MKIELLPVSPKTEFAAIIVMQEKINELVGIVNDMICEFSAMGIEIYDTTKQHIPISKG